MMMMMMTENRAITCCRRPATRRQQIGRLTLASRWMFRWTYWHTSGRSRRGTELRRTSNVERSLSSLSSAVQAETECRWRPGWAQSTWVTTRVLRRVCHAEKKAVWLATWPRSGQCTSPKDRWETPLESEEAEKTTNSVVNRRNKHL